ncbi:NADP-dependent oxidoreductase domain [Phytophthora cactorum]|nr:NADP-dependent oxidoreductase domain [Phytophthora cactorum]
MTSVAKLAHNMKYRFLGNTGLLVSKFAFGSFVTLTRRTTSRRPTPSWSTPTKTDLVISTKIFFGAKMFSGGGGPNDTGLSRKHIVEGTKASLKRFGLDYVDLIFCHRQDPYTPMEEIVRAMNYVIEQGWAFYWGTSEWTAAEIMEACEVADRLGLIRPVCCAMMHLLRHWC